MIWLQMDFMLLTIPVVRKKWTQQPTCLFTILSKSLPSILELTLHCQYCKAEGVYSPLYSLGNVTSLASICSSTTSTLFSKHLFRQSHTCRDRQIKRKDCCVGVLGTSLMLQEQQASLHFHAMIGRQGLVVVNQICIPGLNCTAGIPIFFFVFDGITSCGSASLKLCVLKTCSPLEPKLFPRLTVQGQYWQQQNPSYCGITKGQKSTGSAVPQVFGLGLPRDNIHQDTYLAFPHIVSFFIIPSHYIGFNTINIVKVEGAYSPGYSQGDILAARKS